jgi:sulfur carrier protein ThiS adenylyltransferase
VSAEALRLFTISDQESLAGYPGTLFPGAEAQQGACTARTTFYAATIAAGWMVSLYSRWPRGMAVPGDVVINLLADELEIASAFIDLRSHAATRASPPPK